MVICYIVADGISEYNSSGFRVSTPADALLRAGYEVHILNVRQWMAKTEYARSICQKADIIHLQRVLVTDTHGDILYWRSKGKAVVVDFDDAYQMIHDDNAAAPFWLHGEVEVRLPTGVEYSTKMDEHPVDQFQKGLDVCTALITPSAILSDDWRVGAPEFVVPNFLDTKLYRAAPKHNNSPNIILGWGGSLSHVQSWKDSGINEALQQILQERDNIRLLIVGDHRVVDQLPMRKDRIMFSPYTAWWNWQNTLMRYDIGLAPLAGDYDDRRSNLKVAEYLMSGLPFAATKSPVYEEFFEADSGRFVEHGYDKENYQSRTEDWYYSTMDIIDRIEYYRDRAESNIETYGMRYDADRGVSKIISVYKQIIELEK